MVSSSSIIPAFDRVEGNVVWIQIHNAESWSKFRIYRIKGWIDLIEMMVNVLYRAFKP